MHYVMSDLHGCYDKYLAMLEKLHFRDDDVLYYLGDAVDRGPDGIPLVLDLMGRGNVMPLLGNHEDMFRTAIRSENSHVPPIERAEVRRSFRNWTQNNGGDITWQAYLALPEAERRRIARWLETLPLYYEIRISGRQFLLIHAGVGSYTPDKDLRLCTAHDFLWGRMDYSRVYYPDRYLVTGHTPTVLIDPTCRGRIFSGNNHIAVDCGTVFLGTLGCLCLDTLEEFYL